MKSHAIHTILIKNTALVLLFTLLASGGLWQHEIWADEARAWLIARDTSWANLPFVVMCERHLITWYALLKVLTIITHDPIAMQLLALGIGMTTYALIVIFAPFSTLQKILLGFSYYLLFEYTIISRVYGLTALSVIALCIATPYRRQRPLLFIIACAGTAITSLFGIFYGAIMFMLLVLDIIQRKVDLRIWPLGIACIGFALLFTYHLSSIVLAPGCAHHYEMQFTINAAQAVGAIHSIAQSFFLLSDGMGNSNIASGHAWAEYLLSCAFIGTMAATLLAIRQQRAALLPLLGILAVIFIYQYIKPGYASSGFRQLGIVFLAYIVALWQWQREALPATRPAIINLLFYAVLLCQAASGLLMYYQDWRHPFSMGPATAEYLKKHNLDRLWLIPAFDLSAASHLIYTKQKFMPYYGPASSYVPLTDNLWPPANTLVAGRPIPHQTFLEIREMLKNLHPFVNAPGALITSNVPVDPALEQQFKLQRLATFEGALVHVDNYFIYLLPSAPGKN
jgi:hypothetical protein